MRLVIDFCLTLNGLSMLDQFNDLEHDIYSIYLRKFKESN